jgi:hypothetical protein
VKLAELQQGLAETQRHTYQEWIDAGLNQWEQDMLQNYEDAKDARNASAKIEAALTVAQAVTSASSGGFLGSGLGGRYRLGSGGSCGGSSPGYTGD